MSAIYNNLDLVDYFQNEELADRVLVVVESDAEYLKENSMWYEFFCMYSFFQLTVSNVQPISNLEVSSNGGFI